MSILERPLLRASQRFDLEDLEVLLSGLRTDAKFWHLRFLSEKSYIMQGFTIDSSFIGQQTAEIDLEAATLINADAAQDYSWFTAPLSPDPLVIPAGVGGLLPGRNFVELVLGTDQGTPLSKAFWDPSANSGLGLEFIQEVDTVESINISVVVNQVSFSVSPDRIQLAIIDVDGSGNIRGIQDKRELFFRLGTPDDPSNEFTWGSKVEPTTTLTFTVPAVTAFEVGETVGFTSGAQAIVVVGGTQNIQVNRFTNINFEPGDTVVGLTSGASAALVSYAESFSGADKNIKTIKDAIDAIMTEIKAIKGSNFWFETSSATSLPSVLAFVATFMSPLAAGARFSWTGTNLLISDNKVSGQASSDVIGAIRTPGNSNSVLFTRQDGTGGSTSLAIPDQNILYVELPDAGSNRTYSESGPLATNYKTSPISSFVLSDKNYIIAYREGSKLIFPGKGELDAGESEDIGSEISKELLAFIGASSDTDDAPAYTTTPDPILSNQFSVGASLVAAISTNAANINDIATGLKQVYYEPLLVTSAAPVDSNEVQGPLVSSDMVVLPLDSRNSNASKKYMVGSGALMVFRNGQHQNLGEDYLEVGVIGTLSDEVMVLNDIAVGEKLEFRISTPEIFGTAALDQPFFVNYVTGQNGGQVPVGALYNVGTSKLSVYRNGQAMHNTSMIGSLIQRYQEVNNSSVTISENANPAEVFTFVNRESPSPASTLISGVTGTVLTIPTYVIGSGRLMVYRNGVLLSLDPGADASLKYAETSTTSITLDLAAVASDVFLVFNAAVAPTFRETLMPTAGSTLLTIPNSETYTTGDQKLLVFRNGLLMLNSSNPALSEAVSRYVETSSTEITIEEASVAGDLFEFVYI